MRAIIVPKTIESQNELEYYTGVDDDLIIETISDAEMEYLFLTGPLNEVSLKLDKSFIAPYEEDRIIDISGLNLAKDLTIESIKKNKARVLDVLLLQIDNAIKYRTGIYFLF